MSLAAVFGCHSCSKSEVVNFVRSTVDASLLQFDAYFARI